jgi:putative ABC transport system permease protein
MLAVTASSLWAHKRRLAGTVFAIFLGVAFLTGTLALSDTLRANFNSLFANANAGTDAVVRSSTTIGGRGLDQPTLIAASLLDRVRSAPGVADAQPVIAGYGQLIGADGKAIGGNGPPRQAGNWITDPALNPYRLVQGRAPQADNEVVINRGAATSGKLHVGDTTVVQIPEPVPVRIVGIATLGTAEGFGQATYTAFTLHGAQAHILNNAAQLSSIAVRARPGVTQDQLTASLARILPAGVEAISGAQLTANNIADITNGFLNALRTFLTVFAAIALLVATFSINNTLSILVAQRGRESALLRAVGATRRQILTAVATESLLIGTVASIAGVASGIGVAGLLKGLFDTVGFKLPAGGLVLRPATILLAPIVGVVVTAVAGLAPAIRASRVAPMAALRDVAAEPTRPSALRVAAGVVLGAIGMTVVVSAVTGHGSGVLARAGIGALLTIVAVVILGPAVAAPSSATLAAPLVRLRGYTGALARQNVVRNPRRTSATAAALMVGVSVVTLFTVFAASLKGSITTGVTRSVRADLVIATGSFGGGGLSARLASDVASLPQVADAAGLGDGNALIAGSREKVSILDPAKAAPLINLDPARGSLADLGAQQLAVSKKTADAKRWKVGTVVPVVFPDSATQDLTVGLIYNSRDLAGDYLLPQTLWAADSPQSVDSAVFIAVAPGVPPSAAKAAVTRVAAAYGNPTVDTRQAYATTAGNRVNIILGLVYVMLALAIIIALLGIANTLSLSTFERTRELGLLRAVGQTRSQLRAMVRWESVTIAVFGTVGGLAVGLFLGWALVTAANTAGTLTGFAAPPGQLITILVVGGLAGVLAGVRPARRAARINVLAAVATQ